MYFSFKQTLRVSQNARYPSSRFRESTVVSRVSWKRTWQTQNYGWKLEHKNGFVYSSHHQYLVNFSNRIWDICAWTKCIQQFILLEVVRTVILYCTGLQNFTEYSRISIHRTPIFQIMRAGNVYLNQKYIWLLSPTIILRWGLFKSPMYPKCTSGTLNL